MLPLSRVSSILIAIAMILPIQAFSQSHNTFSCKDPPSKEAIIGVWQTRTVSVFKDSRAQSCSFSVDGAPVSSPPVQHLIGALNTFRQGGAVMQGRGSETTSALGLLLIAAAPFNETPRELSEILSRSRDLNQCVVDFFRGASVDVVQNQLRCTSMSRSTSLGRERSLEQYGAWTAEDVLMIAVRWDNFEARLYLPRALSTLLPLR